MPQPNYDPVMESCSRNLRSRDRRDELELRLYAMPPRPPRPVGLDSAVDAAGPNSRGSTRPGPIFLPT